MADHNDVFGNDDCPPWLTASQESELEIDAMTADRHLNPFSLGAECRIVLSCEAPIVATYGNLKQTTRDYCLHYRG